MEERRPVSLERQHNLAQLEQQGMVMREERVPQLHLHMAVQEEVVPELLEEIRRQDNRVRVVLVWLIP